MLIKSINVNLKMVKTEIGISVVALMMAVLFFVLLSRTFLGVLLMAASISIAVGVMIRGYSKIFCTSVYEEEAWLYMTLPIKKELILWGKALAGTIWAVFMVASLITFSYFFLEMYSGGTTLAMFLTETGPPLPPMKTLLVDAIDVEMTPLQTAISMGLVPTTIAISICVGCFFIMAFQQFVGQSREKKSKPNMVVFAIFIFVGLNIGVWFLMNKLEGIGVDRFLISLSAPILYIGVGAVLYFYCKKKMDGSY